MPVQHISLDCDFVATLQCWRTKHHCRHVLLFTGQRSYEESAFKETLESAFAEHTFTRYAEVTPNPTIEEIAAGVRFFRQHRCDGIVAVGGGSILDAAKLITFFANQSFTIQEFFANKHDAQPTPLPPILAIPTTAGTGSESTQFATLYINGLKSSLDHPYCLPGDVILNPAFTRSLPATIAAQTGVDALAQAIESFWNVRSTTQSQQLAATAIPLIIENLPKCVAIATGNSYDPKPYLAMLRAANLAGQAIQITRTTAVHAVSYPMTSRFGIAHGQAVAILLPHFYTYNRQVDAETLWDKRGLAHVQGVFAALDPLLGIRSPTETAAFFKKFYQAIGLKTTLRDFNIGASEKETLINEGFTPSRMKNNPRAVTANQLATLLANA